MYTLYEYPPTRSHRVRWVLEEIGADWQSALVDLETGAQDAPDYRAVHPLGVVPALGADGFTMFESAAIVLHLADAYPEAGLMPPPGSAERAQVYQWCVFAAGEVDPAAMLVFDNTMRPLEAMRPPGAPHDPGQAARGRWMWNERAEALSDALGGRDHLVGDAFTAADIVVGHCVFMATHIGLMEGQTALQAYWDRLSERPAHKRVYAG